MTLPTNGPAFILGVVTVTIGRPKRFIMHVQHNREAFKPTKLFAHITEREAFILEKVQWGIHGCEHLAGPLDLDDFGLMQSGLALAMPRLDREERVSMSVLYTGRTLRGFNPGTMFSLPIIWAEPGASLLHSTNATLSYSVECQ